MVVRVLPYPFQHLFSVIERWHSEYCHFFTIFSLRFCSYLWGVFCLCVCLCNASQGVHGGQRGCCIHSVGLELQTAVSHHVGAESQTRVLQKSSWRSAHEPSLQQMLALQCFPHLRPACSPLRCLHTVCRCPRVHWCSAHFFGLLPPYFKYFHLSFFL